MNIYIYVDDIREDDKFFNSMPIVDNQHWDGIICRSYYDTIRMLQFYKYRAVNIFIDLDHDLGEEFNSNSGYDICKWIIDNQFPLYGFHIHSMNPVGAMNMRQLLTHYGYREL